MFPLHVNFERVEHPGPGGHEDAPAVDAPDRARPPLLTTEPHERQSSQLADELGISRRSVARYVQAGILVPELYTPGGQGRFDLADSKQQRRDHSREQRGED